MSFRRAIAQGAVTVLGTERDDDTEPYGLDVDKIEERAEWLDGYRFRMVRHGHGRATLETYEARWDARARPFTLTRRGAEPWTHPSSGRQVVGAWRVDLIDARPVEGRHQEIAEYIAERESGNGEDR